MKKLTLALLSVTALLSGITAQNNCVPVIPGSYNQVVNLPAGVNCTALSVKVPHIKQTSDYAVLNWPYDPLAYTSASGTEVTSIYVDDQFSAVINLPFSVCFYDSIFNKLVIGSNGLITFDVSNASCSNAWDLRNNIPIPYAGGSACVTTPEYYPRASLMGIYTDLDPRAGQSPATKKIEYRVEGTAPCRKFIVSYNDIKMYSTSGCPDLNTFQFVISEGTSIVDINIKNKSVCTSWNNGNAISGLQNWARTKATVATGRNCTQWSATNQSYRFIPFGGTSRFVKSELLYNNVVIASADTSTSAPGELKINFPNVCPPTTTAMYVIRTEFTPCGTGTGPGQNLFRFDTITVNKTNNLLATATAAPASCNQNNGVITFATPSYGTPPYQYSINNGGTFQAGNVFSGLAAGLYNCVVKDAGTGITNLQVTVTSSNNLSATATATPVLCNGGNTGSITVTPANGTAPYQYSLNGGGFQTGNVFSNLTAGVYTVQVKDNGNCATTQQVTVSQPAVLVVSATTTNATCAANPDGQINASATGGFPPYTYSINGTTFQASGQFLVVAGNYTVTLRDNNGCIKTTQVTVGLTNVLTLQSRTDTIICRGDAVNMTTTSTATSFTWTPTAGLNNAAIASPVATPQATTTYIVTGQLGSCTKKDTVVISVNPSPAVNAGPDLSILFGDETALQGSGSGGTFLWTPSVGLNATNIPNPVANPTLTTTYLLTVTNNLGCKASDSMKLTVIPYCVKVRNAFTPNGDGRNDQWLVTDTYDCLKNITVNVFNRYGNKVYENRNYRNDWTGTYKGQPVPDGTYYYVIDFTLITGRVMTVKGDLTILR